MISKKTKHLLAGIVLSGVLATLSGCGSNLEDKVEADVRVYKDSFQKVAYQFDKNDQIGYLEYKAKAPNKVWYQKRYYFKADDTKDRGYIPVAWGLSYDDWIGDLKYDDYGTPVSTFKEINDEILADFYAAAVKSDSYNMEDCVIFYKNLHKKYGDIVKAVYTRDGINREDKRRKAVKEFQRYLAQAPDVVAKYCKGEEWSLAK